MRILLLTRKLMLLFNLQKKKVVDNISSEEVGHTKTLYSFINCNKLGSVEICGSSFSSAIYMCVYETRDVVSTIYHSGNRWIRRISSKPSS